MLNNKYFGHLPNTGLILVYHRLFKKSNLCSKIYWQQNGCSIIIRTRTDVLKILVNKGAVTMHGTYVLKNKKRFYIFLLLISFLITIPFFASTVYGYKEPSYVTINVNEGDNLWNLVSDYSKGRDIRKYINEVKKLNKMDDSVIYPGQSILLPLKWSKINSVLYPLESMYQLL